MKILRTDSLDFTSLDLLESLALYNGMDCMMPIEIHEALASHHTDTTRATYHFMFQVQTPVLAIMLNGTWVDPDERRRMIFELDSKVARLRNIIDRYALAMWEMPLNPASPKQKADFFYNFLGITPYSKYDHKTKKSRPTTDRDAITKIRNSSHLAKPIANAMLAFAELNKLLGIIKAPIEKDGYFRASYGVTGTETGRLNSTKNVFNRGNNDQNWPEFLRRIFSAPPGPLPRRENFNIPEEFLSLPPVD